MRQPYLDIEQVYHKSDQGMSGVYYCKGEDGQLYWVKGHNVGRVDQIKEWLCGHLALAFGLPVAPFLLANIDEYLAHALPLDQLPIGHGPMFASRHAGAASLWFGSVGQIARVPENTQRDLLLFDYWIQNSDRQSHNPNLLWDASQGKLVVIDHNLAFDADFEPKTLLETHIFTDVDRSAFRDLTTRCEYIARMDKAIAAMEGQIASIPSEWQWADLEQTRPTDLDLAAMLTTLKRHQTQENEDFWSVL